MDEARWAAREVGRFLQDRSLVTLACLVAIAAVFRSGFAFAPISDVVLRENRAVFPEPVGSTEATSYGLRAVFWGLGVESIGHARVVALMFTVGCLISALVLLAVTLRGARFRILLLVVLLGPMGTVLLGNIGRSDVLLLTGSIFVALAPYTRWAIGSAVVGALLMVAGNPEQALVSAAILVALSRTSRMRHFQRPSLVLLGISLLGYIVLTAASVAGGEQTRTGALPDNIKASLALFFENLPLVLYSGYTVLWLLIGIAVIRARGWDRLILLAALVAVPLVLTATTLDQTRVWVGVSTLGILALVVVETENSRLEVEERKATIALGALALAFLLTPAIEVTFEGSVRVPLEWIYNLGLGAISGLT